MNKQELIKEFREIGVYNLSIFGTEIKGIPTESAITLIEQLDEPKTGHADEAPRYVKNILARLRELPLHDREVWLKAIMGEFEQDFSHAKWREGYEQGKFEGAWVGDQLKDADKIRQELNKVKVKQFVADWIKHSKTIGRSLFGAMSIFEENTEIKKWLQWADNQETFARAWLDGYEVEEEKRYFVKIKATKHCFARDGNGKIFFSLAYKGCFTKKELEEANFGWVFDCEGVEVEEVE